ncbi:MAG: hypothetical protein RRA92_02430 [Gemmatimonadota bacterium]|nr:hypothetical protein [Gemmatimonadota bacterium]
MAILAAGFLSACGGAARTPLPLRPEPIAWADTLPIPEPPDREVVEAPHLVNDALAGEVSDGISLRTAFGEDHEALNLTHFDDVVPSAWFEHRNAARPLTPDEVRRGPTTAAGPDTTGAMEIVSAKVEGIAPGFNLRDGRGDTYVVKFDPEGYLHLSSAAGVIANRLFHAAGYHVPEDYIFVFDRDQLSVAEGAVFVDEEFEEHPLTLERLEDVFEGTDRLADGRFLAVASKFVAGPPKGPFLFEGRRGDDPNDHFAHEHRRELRGLKVVASWVNHIDIRFMNTMDAYVQPGYLRHYLIDFAASLGSGTIRPHEPREGREHNVDFWASTARILTAGFYRVGWEGREWEVIEPSIGWMEVDEFDPGAWKANWPNNAFRNMTARDAYWGAKLVGSFTDEQIRAAVAAGELPTSTAADTLADILILRRDRIVDHWYRHVSPLENPVLRRAAGDGVAGATGPAAGAAESYVLEFDDLGIAEGLWAADRVRYEWELEHDAADRHWRGAGEADPAGTEGSAAARRSLRIAATGGSPGRVPGGGLAGREALAELRVRVVGEDGRRYPPATMWLRWQGADAGYGVVGLEH